MLYYIIKHLINIFQQSLTFLTFTDLFFSAYLLLLLLQSVCGLKWGTVLPEGGSSSSGPRYSTLLTVRFVFKDPPNPPSRTAPSEQQPWVGELGSWHRRPLDNATSAWGSRRDTHVCIAAITSVLWINKLFCHWCELSPVIYHFWFWSRISLFALLICGCIFTWCTVRLHKTKHYELI